MDYQAADVLSRKNKEFILSLYPSDTIYETLLPIEARHAIGKVGKETEPVKKMLQAIGFKYIHEVDPFDGGPHYRAKKSNISLIKNMGKGELHYLEKQIESKHKFLVNVPSEKYFFEATVIDGIVEKANEKVKLITDDPRVKELTSQKTIETNFIKF